MRCGEQATSDNCDHTVSILQSVLIKSLRTQALSGNHPPRKTRAEGRSTSVLKDFLCVFYYLQEMVHNMKLYPQMLESYEIEMFADL